MNGVFSALPKSFKHPGTKSIAPVTPLTQKLPGFDFPRAKWPPLNRIRTQSKANLITYLNLNYYEYNLKETKMDYTLAIIKRQYIEYVQS